MSTTLEEFPECPLCMEVFEMDDLNFFPCTCGYQICRFCWHRLRTDENGLCPACRKSYPEDPAQFKPLTDDEVHKIKKGRRQKDTQRKQKSAENRKHLTNVRVVQKNLIFVVGLSQRLADPEILKKTEYFGKFGKIHKVVINQSTAYIGSQGPNASAYVTYVRPEDALSAIKVVNNLQVDGRTIKASLGTTKYCSHFLKATQCLKTDCMYLHDLGDEVASFTKEEIQQGKHVQYEQTLYDYYLTNSELTTTKSHPKHATTADGNERCEGGSPLVSSLLELNPESSFKIESSSSLLPKDSELTNGINTKSLSSSPPTLQQKQEEVEEGATPSLMVPMRPSPFALPPEDHLSLFSDTGFNRNIQRHKQDTTQSIDEEVKEQTEIRETIRVNSSTDWQQAFGFPSTSDTQDDDLGFDPYVISTKGLADMIEKEKENNYSTVEQSMSHVATSIHQHHHHPSNNNMFNSGLQHPKMNLPPFGFNSIPHPNGFTQEHHLNINPLVAQHNNKMFNYMGGHLGTGTMSLPRHPCNMTSPTSPAFYRSEHIRVRGQKPHDLLFHQTQIHPPSVVHPHPHPPPQLNFNLQDWQDGLKALLPNINISFGTSSLPPQQHQQHRDYRPTTSSGFNSSPSVDPTQSYLNNPDKNWSSLSSHSMPDLNCDPAIINTGAITDSLCNDTTTPHWMASLHHLTEEHNSTSSASSSYIYPSYSMS